MSVLIIAEAGVNHNGDSGMARALVDAASDAGADFVKFQSFVPEALAAAAAEKAAYQKRAGGSMETQRDMLSRLALSRDEERGINDHCAARGITMLSTPFDMASLTFVVQELRVPSIKMSSGSLTNGPLLHAAAITGLPLILSTGMATIDEVAEAVDLVAWTAIERLPPRSRADFAGYASTSAGREIVAERVTLLHCTTAYPTPLPDVNLRAIDKLATTFPCQIGYSDHTEGIAVSIAAVGSGARMIEKHFTLDRTLLGPDHAASLEPAELANLVAGVRAAAVALGSPEKQLTPSERENALVARQSLVALEPIAAGMPVRDSALGVKRPGTGASPMAYWDYLGKPAPRAYDADEVIDP